MVHQMVQILQPILNHQVEEEEVVVGEVLQMLLVEVLKVVEQQVLLELVQFLRMQVQQMLLETVEYSETEEEEEGEVCCIHHWSWNHLVLFAAVAAVPSPTDEQDVEEADQVVLQILHDVCQVQEEGRLCS